ncbi:MAG: Do family serine endopeptidase [Nitratireductor sp.]
MQTIFRVLLASLFLAFAVQHASSQTERQNALEDVFKKTLDELFNNQVKGKNQNNSNTPQTVEKIPQSKAEINLTFAPLVRQVAPSVVNVYAARKVEQRRSPFAGGPFFERFFGNRRQGRPSKRIQSSLGSGVIVSTTGTILTNHHVIEGADEVKIALSDGAEYEAEILLKDEKSDLAVLQIKEDIRLPAIEIGDSENVQVGDLVLAIGNPFGVGQTVTSGIVSAVARSQAGIKDFGFFIQTDAAINPGNSGGALIDMKGRLIGINTAIFSRSGGSNGIGFAVPSNMANVVLNSANSGNDKLARPWLGATFQTVTPEIAQSLGMRRPGGVLVAKIIKDSPAEQSGMRIGDVIIGINKKIIKGVDGFGYRLDTIGIGKTAELVVISKGKRKVLNIKLESAKETTARNETYLDPQTVLGGAVVANLSPAVAQELGLSGAEEGVIVLEVTPRTRAAANGVRKGDIVLSINDVEVDNVSEVSEIVAKPNRRGWRVALQRANRTIIFERRGGFFRQYVR